MNQVALQKQIDDLRKETRISGEDVDERLIELQAEIDGLKLDVAALKAFLEAEHPHFPEKFEVIRQATRRTVNPEVEG